MNRKLLVFLFIVSFTIPFSAFTEPEKSMDFFLTPYFSYKSHLYYKDAQKYSENYATLGVEGSYILNDFLIISLGAEAGGLMSLYAKGTNTYFTSSVTDVDKSVGGERSIYLLQSKLELYFYTNPENMFYLGPMVKYISLGNAIQEKQFDGTATITQYDSASTTQTLFGFCMGDRFLLYPGVTFNLEVGFFSKGFLPSQEKPLVTKAETGDFSNYFLEMRIGIGTYF